MMTIQIAINDRVTDVIDVVNRGGRSGGVFTYSVQRFDRVKGKVTTTEVTHTQDEGRVVLTNIVMNKLKELDK